MALSSLAHSGWQCFSQKITTSLTLTNKFTVLPTCFALPLPLPRGEKQKCWNGLCTRSLAQKDLAAKSSENLPPGIGCQVSLSQRSKKPDFFVAFFSPRIPMPLAKVFFNSSVWVEKLFSKPFPGQGMLKRRKDYCKATR